MEPLRGGMLANHVPDEVKKLYKNNQDQYSPAAWALKWIWNHPEVVCVLSGMNNEDHIIENCQVGSSSLPNSLSNDQIELMNEVKQIYKKKIKVACTGCRYCMPCPVGVNIPGCFELYNNKSIFEKSKLPKFEYTFRLGGLFGKKSWASLCIDCGQCEKVCPQHIEIRKELKEVKRTFEGIIPKMLLGVSKPALKLVRIFSRIHVKRVAKKKKTNS